MKLKNIILTGIAAIGFASCNDWLDIQPKTEIKMDKMFETESGFKNALIGGYIMMTDSDRRLYHDDRFSDLRTRDDHHLYGCPCPTI